VRKAKRLAQKISRLAASKSPKATGKMKKLYRKLIGMVEELLKWSTQVEKEIRRRVAHQQYGMNDEMTAKAVLEQFAKYIPLGHRVKTQARQRVIEEQPVANAEKVFSIFEPHTELLIRGKAGKNIEFGHMIQIQQVDGKFITGYNVFEIRPDESMLIRPALEEHKALFGNYPERISADKGYYEDMESIHALEAIVPTISIAKKGGRTAAEVEREREPAFKDGQRFRAGIEGTISFLKRSLGLFRCFNKGWNHFCSTVGMAIFAHNILLLAKQPA
jgi:transposase, IS5 family